MRYGIIGNGKTCALIHEDASIDWCCLPKFDSPSAFAAILDPDGGRFQIRSPSPMPSRQYYIPKTNILATEFDDQENAFVVIDFMPRYREGNIYKKPLEIHRIVKPLKGKPLIEVVFDPKLNYAEKTTNVKRRPDFITASQGMETLFLYSSSPLEKILSREPVSLLEEQYFLLSYHEKLNVPLLGYVYDAYEKTKEYWETWSSHCRLPELYSDVVLRSALTLKLLIYEDSGAIIAAPTTSLPEILNETRNWDYRYCWLRDASLMLDTLKSIGHFEEAKSFIQFLLKIFESKQTKIHIVYGIGGRINLEERILPHLKGYKNTSPVRVGNNAAQTQQNDIFGEILHTLYLYYFHYQMEPMPEEVWSLVKFLVNTISRDWQTPDAGVWEFRHRKEHFTFSKILSWVAIDRGIRIARGLNKNYAVENWTPIEKNIREDIDNKGWAPDIDSYTQVYGSKNLDASLLLLHYYGFLAHDDPRWIATIKQCESSLAKNGFVFRYTNSDDFGKPKNAFIMAGLLLAKAFCTIGEKRKAEILFEKTISHANHLGLLSEDIDIETGELLGNFPQAYSHIALINAANSISLCSLSTAPTLPDE